MDNKNNQEIERDKLMEALPVKIKKSHFFFPFSCADASLTLSHLKELSEYLNFFEKNSLKDHSQKVQENDDYSFMPVFLMVEGIDGHWKSCHALLNLKRNDDFTLKKWIFEQRKGGRTRLNQTLSIEEYNDISEYYLNDYNKENVFIFVRDKENIQMTKISGRMDEYLFHKMKELKNSCTILLEKSIILENIEPATPKKLKML